MTDPSTPAGLLIRNASQIVTGPGTALRTGELGRVRIHRDAVLYAEGGRVAAVGDPRTVEASVRGHPEVFDAAGGAVIPGLVDPHTHAVFAGSRVDEFIQKIAGATYAEIAMRGGGILSTVRATREAGKEELKALTRERLRTALEHGTTTMEIKSGYGLDPANELKMLEVIAELGQEQPVELVPTFLGAHAVPAGHTRAAYVAELIGMLPEIASRAKFCDVFCDADYFPPADARRILVEAARVGLRSLVHAGQFSADGGIAMGIERGASALAHLDCITESEIGAFAASPSAGILLPGVSLFGGTPFPPARKMIEGGMIVALATNFNPGSCPSLSMPMMVSLACMGLKMSPEEALNAATTNAAYALGLPGLGRIEPGLQADLAVLHVPDYRMIPYHFGVNPVVAVAKKGRIVWCRA